MHTLISFSSYFEICFGLSLGYAGLRFVRNNIINNIFRLDSSLFSKINLSYTEVVVKIGSEEVNLTEELKMNDDLRSSYLIEQRTELITNEKKSRVFLDNFRSLFFINSLYCLCLIIFSGISDYFPKSYIFCKNVIFCIALLVTFFSIIMFTLSIINRTIDKKASPFLTFILFCCF